MDAVGLFDLEGLCYTTLNNLIQNIKIFEIVLVIVKYYEFTISINVIKRL